MIMDLKKLEQILNEAAKLSCVESISRRAVVSSVNRAVAAWRHNNNYKVIIVKKC